MEHGIVGTNHVSFTSPGNGDNRTIVEQFLHDPILVHGVRIGVTVAGRLNIGRPRTGLRAVLGFPIDDKVTR